MQNEMKIYLKKIGTEYSDNNYIMNWLLYWRGNTNDCSSRKSEAWRMENDLDCLYMGKLEADTIISVFQILKRVILCIDSKQKIKKDAESINRIIEQFDTLLPPNDELVQSLQKLAKKAELRSNFMLLPDRKMQSRGVIYGDAMAPTLYQCFDTGRYSKYFTDNYTVINWIEDEKLRMLFEDNTYDKEHIKPMIAGWSAKQSFKGTRKRELLSEIINYSNAFLDARQKFYS